MPHVVIGDSSAKYAVCLSPPRSPESQGQPHHKKVSYAAAPGLRAVAARALRTPTRAQPQTKHVHILWG